MEDKIFELCGELTDISKQLIQIQVTQKENDKKLYMSLIATIVVISIMFCISLCYTVNKMFNYESYPTTPSITNTNSNTNTNTNN